MKFKWLIFALIFIVLFSCVEAKKKQGKLSVNASVSVFDPPGDVSSALLFEVSAKYKLSNKVTTEMSVGWSQYESGGQNVTLIPVQLNGELHPLGRGMFDPYVGCGIGAYFTQTGEDVTATAGVQGLGGLSFSPQDNFSFSVEIKYMLTDVTDPESGGWSLGGGADINWETPL
ncbi:hypothetical protein DRQ33_04430 [bacterium]|nr:MAG: hypothetical protein DRQ33_04430 [bacterium]